MSGSRRGPEKEIFLFCIADDENQVTPTCNDDVVDEMTVSGLEQQALHFCSGFDGFLRSDMRATMGQFRISTHLPAGTQMLSGSTDSHSLPCWGVAAAGQVPQEDKPARFLVDFSFFLGSILSWGNLR